MAKFDVELDYKGMKAVTYVKTRVSVKTAKLVGLRENLESYWPKFVDPNVGRWWGDGGGRNHVRSQF